MSFVICPTGDWPFYHTAISTYLFWFFLFPKIFSGSSSHIVALIFPKIFQTNCNQIQRTKTKKIAPTPPPPAPRPKFFLRSYESNQSYMSSCIVYVNDADRPWLLRMDRPFGANPQLALHHCMNHRCKASCFPNTNAWSVSVEPSLSFTLGPCHHVATIHTYTYDEPRDMFL